MNRVVEQVLSVFPAIFLLTACVGGGGGSGSAIVGGGGPAPFTKWSDITPVTTIAASGISQDASYTAPAPTFVLTSLTDHGTSSASTATITYGAGGSVERISINTPHTSLTWDQANGDIFTPSPSAIAVLDPLRTKFGVALEPTFFGWDYQTYGIWETGRGLGSGDIGAISVGAPTAGSAIPVTGVATFTGRSSGMYINATGTEDYITDGLITVNANFVTRTLGLATTGTVKMDTMTLATTVAPNLDMTGTLTYEAGANSFTGPVTATGLAGKSTGQFYGPNAEELGGVFSLTGAGFESHAGAYGAKR
jgi:hypothetical protein